MSIGNLTRHLDLHRIHWREEDGRLLALEVMYDSEGRDASEWVDVTGFARQRLYEWLGY